MKRLTETNYQRPKETLQDKLNKNDIKKMLKNYKEISSFSDVPLSSHLRYFSNVDGEMKFRTGGNLINKNNADKYVVLSNGKVTWSVDTKKSIFYKEITHEDIVDKYEEQIAKYKLVIKKLRNEIEQLKSKK